MATRQEVEARLARCRGLLAGSSDRDSAEVTEQLLVSLAPLLHEDHSYRVQLKSRLVFSYNSAAGSRQQLDRQLQLAEQVRLQLVRTWRWLELVRAGYSWLEQVLAVLDRIDPGLTPRRGGLLKHVVELRMRRANMDVKEGTIDKAEHLADMRSSMVMMREVMKCLKHSITA